MAAKASRLVKLYVTVPPATEGTLLAGIKTKSITFAEDGIDTTNDDDNGFRTLLDDTAAVRSLDIEFSGVEKDGVVAAWRAAGAHRACTIEFPLQGAETTPRTIAGEFRLTSYAVEGSNDGAVEYSATLQSTGSYT